MHQSPTIHRPPRVPLVDDRQTSPDSDFPVDLDAELATFISGGGLTRFPFPGAPFEADDMHRLGAEQTASLLMACRFGEQIAINGPLFALRARQWREGLTSAYLCEALANARGIAGPQGFLCGLNHDVGRTFTVGCLEVMLTGRRSLPAMPEAFWLDFVDRHHVRVGLQIAESWLMTPEIRAVIAAHHEDSIEGLPQAELLELVRIADHVNAALASTSHVPVKRLAAIPGIQPNEIPIVARLIEGLPGFLSAMERYAKQPVGGPTRSLIRQDRGVTMDPHSLVMSLTCSSGGRCHPYESQGIVEGRLLAHGRVPLREHFLTEVTVEIGPGLHFWAEVVTCVPHEGRTWIELRPFALDAEDFENWCRLA